MNKLIAVIVLVAGCGGGADIPLEPLTADATLVHSKIATVAVAIVTAHEGRGFFDNYLACARRGVDETLEVGRGDHTHELTCGTSRVTVDRARNLPRLDHTWNGCAVNSVFISGTFSSEWSEFDASRGRLAMILNGAMTFGGGVPCFSADRIEWNVAGIFPLPGTATFSGRIVRGAQQRTFSYTVVVDD